MNKYLYQIKKEIKENILYKYKFIQDYKIIKVYNPHKDFLGFYKHNSIWDGKPIIKLNIPIIIEARKNKEGDLSLYDILLTTILHELAHSIQQFRGGMGYYNERAAEDFAYSYWLNGQVLSI
jgi:hypothetical protein